MLEFKEYKGRYFSATLGSDIQRDGMFLELYEIINGGEVILAEIFFSDVDLSFTYSSFDESFSIPLEVLEGFISASREKLPPINVDVI